MTEPIRLAILGCGAITRSEHIPAVSAHPGVQLVALVDTDLPRAHALIRNRGLNCRAVADYREVLGQVDAVINALPNHLHVSSNMDCLRAGRHVLCEKPLAITAAEARSCTEFAEEKKLVLAVGMNRRFAASHPLLKLIIEEGLLGSIQNYDFQYGGAFDWRSASGFYFDRAKAGGGALLDFGVHMLDSVIDWFGPVSAFDYQDDDWGSGIEANVLLDLKHAGRFGEITGHLQISRTFGLKNRILVRGVGCQRRDYRAQSGGGGDPSRDRRRSGEPDLNLAIGKIFGWQSVLAATRQFRAKHREPRQAGGGWLAGGPCTGTGRDLLRA